MAEIPHKTFELILAELIEEEGANILSIAGIYEILAEHFNNEIIDIYLEEQKEGG
jgi:hypothetical protein